MEIQEIVVKVASTCNLNCTYCYVFNKGDSSYSYEPNFIDNSIVKQLLQRIEEYAKEHSMKEILIIFHGGEPLLLPISFYENFIELSRKIVKSTKLAFALQSNGTLMNTDKAKAFSKLGIEIGFSLDSTYEGTSERIFKNGKNAYDEIVRGIKIFKDETGYASILAVVNTEIKPVDAYTNICNLGIDNVGYLFPDETYETKQEIIKVGDWLIELFDLWVNDKSNKKPRKFLPFDTIISKIIGQEHAGNAMFGENHNSVISITTNGNIQPVDTLKVCGNNFTKTNLNVLNNKLEDIFDNQLYRDYYFAHQDSMLSNECKKCLIKEICGGGQFEHRYSKINGFNNPSIYCKEIKKLIVHIQNTIYDLLPPHVINDSKLQKIDIKDLL